MKVKVLLLAVLSVVVVGCASIPYINVDTLASPNGKGALAIPTSFELYSQRSYPCHTISLELYEQSNSSSIKLNFYPEPDSNYTLFENIEPGSYIIKSMRCFPPSGQRFRGNLLYLESKGNFEQLIIANKLALSRRGIYGTEWEDGGFKLQFGAKANVTEMLKLVIDDESINGWDFYVQTD
ncbi:hypothetical protein AB6D70_02285 [Vibrio splendidus]